MSGFVNIVKNLFTASMRRLNYFFPQRADRKLKTVANSWFSTYCHGGGNLFFHFASKAITSNRTPFAWRRSQRSWTKVCPRWAAVCWYCWSHPPQSCNHSRFPPLHPQPQQQQKPLPKRAADGETCPWTKSSCLCLGLVLPLKWSGRQGILLAPGAGWRFSFRWRCSALWAVGRSSCKSQSASGWAPVGDGPSAPSSRGWGMYQWNQWNLR